MRVGVAVMAHRKREAFIPELLAALDRPAEVVWDEKQDRWDTGRRSMLAFQNDPDATHWLVIQDDAVVCADLCAGIEKALAFVPPASPLCLYVGKVRPYPQKITRLVNSTRTDTSWLTMSSLIWGVGVVVPTACIPEMIAYCAPLDIANYDRRMSAWFEAKRIPVYYPWPSLVDHRDSPSLVAGRTGGRKAHRFLGADVSALSLPYDGQVLTMPPVAQAVPRQTWRNRKTRRHTSVRVGSSQERALDRSVVWERVAPGCCPTCGRPEGSDVASLRQA